MILSPIHFLAGLPRTGSTLLGSILNQNLDLCVTPTSPLYYLLVKLNEAFNYCSIQHTYDHDRVSDLSYRGLVEAFYGEESRTVFDKHRGWPKHVDAIKQYINPNPKIIATVRPIAEIITSYLVLIQQDEDNFVDRHLLELGCEKPTNEDRANLLWQYYLKSPYECLTEGLKTHPDTILLVSYAEIVFRTQETLDRVYSFCDLEPFNHKFDDLANTCQEERDQAWGLKNLHTIRPSLNRISTRPEQMLPQAAIDYFAQFDIREVSYA